MFESYVILNTTKTVSPAGLTFTPFESYVILNTTKTLFFILFTTI